MLFLSLSLCQAARANQSARAQNNAPFNCAALDVTAAGRGSFNLRSKVENIDFSFRAINLQNSERSTTLRLQRRFLPEWGLKVFIDYEALRESRRPILSKQAHFIASVGGLN